MHLSRAACWQYLCRMCARSAIPIYPETKKIKEMRPGSPRDAYRSYRFSVKLQEERVGRVDEGRSSLYATLITPADGHRIVSVRDSVARDSLLQEPTTVS